jgi:hypothetical protein
MKKLIVRIFLALVILLVLVAVGSIFFLGTIVKSGVEKVGPRVAKVPVKLDSATISIFGGSGELKGFVIGNPEGYKTPQAIKVGTTSLSIAPGSVLKEKKHIRSIKVEGPEITYETDLKGGLKGSNLSKLLDNVGGSAEQDKKAPTKEQQTSKTKLQVDEFIITGAKVHVNASVMGLQGTGYEQAIPLPEIRLKDLGQGPEGITPAELSKKVLAVVLDETVKAVMASGKGIGTGTIDEVKKGAGGLLDSLKKK